MKRRYLTIPFLLLLLGLLIFIQIVSQQTISPQRAKLRDSPFEIMAEPAQHGIKPS